MTEGMQTLYVERRDDVVLLGTPGGDFVLTASMAVDIANALLDCVVEMGHDVQYQAERKQITSMQRAALIARAGHIMRTLEKKSEVVRATHVVDSILADVL